MCAHDVFLVIVSSHVETEREFVVMDIRGTSLCNAPLFNELSVHGRLQFVRECLTVDKDSVAVLFVRLSNCYLCPFRACSCSRYFPIRDSNSRWQFVDDFRLTCARMRSRTIE